MTVTLEEVMTGTEASFRRRQRLEVKAAGVRDGQRIRLSGKADGGGDIYLIVAVEPTAPSLRRREPEPRAAPHARGGAPGGQVHVETPSRRSPLTIRRARSRAGVPPYRQGPPRGKGDGRGDLLVRTRDALPTHLDDKARELATAFVDYLDQPSPRHHAARAAHQHRTEPTKLDRYTEKAQQAILAAHSPPRAPRARARRRAHLAAPPRGRRGHPRHGPCASSADRPRPP